MGNSESRFREAVHNGDFTRAYELFYNKKLIRDNIDPKEVCYQQDSACLLHYTARHAMQPLYEEFLDNRHVSPLITDKHFNNCLHLICSSDRDDDIRCEMLKTTLSNQYLESSEASRSRAVSFCNSEGNTPLHLASCHGLNKCVQLLIEAGASPLVANNDQKTPIDMTTDDTIASKLEAKIVFADTGLNDMDVSVTDTAGEMSSSNLAMKNQEIQSMKDLLVIETSELLGISLFTAEALLRTHEWSKESLVNEWMNDPKGTCEKAGVQLPAVLSIDNICQPVQLARTISSTVDCSICYIDISRPAAIPCGHTFCNDCWKQYLHEKIKNGQVHNIVCPEYACYKLVPVEIVEELVSRDMATKYLQYDIKAFVDSNPNIRWCPFPGCGQALQKPPDEFVLEEGEGGKDEGDRQALVVHCGQNHFFCWRCGEKAHEPCTCKVWKNWLIKVDELSIKIGSMSVKVREAASTSQWMLYNSKPCPNCNVPIEKNDGCNHMRCFKCRHDFCWVCLDHWKKHSTSTGGYYNCNRFEDIKKAEEKLEIRKKEVEMDNMMVIVSLRQLAIIKVTP
jgi:ankyrin repeat/IBR domain-containing protein 1